MQLSIMNFLEKHEALIRPISLLAWLSLLPLTFLTNQISLFIIFSIVFLFGFRYFGGTIKYYFVSLLKFIFGKSIIQSAKEKITKTQEYFDTIIAATIIFSFLLVGMGIVIGQSYYYLKEGNWHSISIIDGLQYFNILWATNPHNWIGLWNILDFIPLSIVLLIFGFTLIANS